MTEKSYDELKASELERAFHTRWRQLASRDAPQPIHNYQFTSNRKFMIDWAWPSYKVGIELQGGTWSGGAHVRGVGYRNDCEKLNLAQSLGWILFWVTTDMLENDPAYIVNLILIELGKKVGKETMIEEKISHEEIEEILERVEEGTTTTDDAKALRELLKDRYQELSKKDKV